LAALDAAPPETEQERAAWRARLAERRLREAHLALEQAEQRGAPPRVLERVAATCAPAVAVYEAAVLACAAHAPSGGNGMAIGEKGEEEQAAGAGGAAAPHQVCDTTQ
jgi:hypothetical protein